MADDDHPVQPERLTRNAAQRFAQEGIVPTPGPNPNYFAGGPEGSAEQQGAGFPQDVTLPEDTDNLVNDLYGAVPPQVSTGTAARRYAADIGPVNRAPGSDPNLGTEFASSEEAERYRKSKTGEQPGSRDSTAMTGARYAFFDPSDPQVRMVAADAPMTGPVGDSSGGQPEVPPAMTPGNPGAKASDPLMAGPTSTPNPGAAGGTPTTTRPRQMPGGRAQQMPGGANPMAAGQNPYMAVQHMADGESRQRPTSENPYGTEDPFDAKTWENAATQRPRIPMEHMNFNGPQNPNARERIRTTNSEPGARQEREQEDED